MKSAFKVIRWFLSIILAILLFAFIIVGLTAGSISTTVTNPKNLKTWLSQGNVYEKVPTAVTTLIQSQGGGQLNQMPVSEEELTEISTAVLEPTWIQKNVENAVDSFYIFLEGKTNLPDFEINIAERKDILVSEIGSQFEGQMGQMAGQQLRAQLEQNELLSQDRIQSTEFIKIKPEEVEKIQTVYGHVQRGIFYVVGIFILISLILFVLVPKLTNKLFVTGLVWAVPSLVFLAGQPMIKNLIKNFYTSKLRESAAGNSGLILEIINKPINLAINDLSSKILIYGGILIAVGAGLLFASYKTKPASEE